jgi:hypothetical protein
MMLRQSHTTTTPQGHPAVCGMCEQACCTHMLVVVCRVPRAVSAAAGDTVVGCTHIPSRGIQTDHTTNTHRNRNRNRNRNSNSSSHQHHIDEAVVEEAQRRRRSNKTDERERERLGTCGCVCICPCLSACARVPMRACVCLFWVQFDLPQLPSVADD